MDSNSRKKLKIAGICQMLKVAVGLLLYVGLVVFLFWKYNAATGEAFTDPSGIAWILMLLVPFAFKVHKKIIDFPWEGTVTGCKDLKGSERSVYVMKSYTPGFVIRQSEMRVVTVTRDDKSIREIVLVGDEIGLGDGYYRVGERVEKFAGLKYPVNYTTSRNEIFCPVCSRFNKMEKKRCYWCKARLIDPERFHLHPEKE